MRGVVQEVRPVVRKGRMRVVARIRTEECGVVEGYLPDREVSALLPRYVLIGEAKEAPRRLLRTISPILRRVAKGRRVRLWKYGDDTYFGFLPWRAVRFGSGGS